MISISETLKQMLFSIDNSQIVHSNDNSFGLLSVDERHCRVPRNRTTFPSSLFMSSAVLLSLLQKHC